ncbi:MAG: hypothetical protein QP756_09530 [Lactobacillus crispatus]|nr:hypothetical protein [Lactobacillus crispatus]MDK7321284.1 hypothetical protein [Lactobacillus crispatus]MDK8273576.1 hypothetical protein [Lactobacillus crispatus]MDK8569735.1 hypothetical protein [Lactobacillus crispatus]
MITIEALHNFPKIEKKCNLSAEIIKTIQKEGDCKIVCVRMNDSLNLFL